MNNLRRPSILVNRTKGRMSPLLLNSGVLRSKRKRKMQKSTLQAANPCLSIASKDQGPKKRDYESYQAEHLKLCRSSKMSLTSRSLPDWSNNLMRRKDKR